MIKEGNKEGQNNEKLERKTEDLEETWMKSKKERKENKHEQEC